MLALVQNTVFSIFLCHLCVYAVQPCMCTCEELVLFFHIEIVTQQHLDFVFPFVAFISVLHFFGDMTQLLYCCRSKYPLHRISVSARQDKNLIYRSFIMLVFEE